MTSITPMNVSAMPRPRRQRMRSPSTSTERSVAIGTPIWPTMEAAEGLAVCKPDEEEREAAAAHQNADDDNAPVRPRHRQEPGEDGERDRGRAQHAEEERRHVACPPPRPSRRRC